MAYKEQFAALYHKQGGYLWLFVVCDFLNQGVIFRKTHGGVEGMFWRAGTIADLSLLLSVIRLTEAQPIYWEGF
jgi:hypothetical protein